MLRGQRLARAALALLLRFKLTGPTPDGAFTKFHVFTDLLMLKPWALSIYATWSLKLVSKTLRDFVVFTAVAIQV
jgi:hypothetical protein